LSRIGGFALAAAWPGALSVDARMAARQQAVMRNTRRALMEVNDREML
jgi:hypothetical protein